MLIQPDRYIVVGKVGAPVGLSGTVKINSYTQNPEEIFDYTPWYIKRQDEWLEIRLEKSAQQGKYLVAKWAESSDRDKAQLWTNSEIAVKRSQLPALPEGEYYWTDLEGMKVKTLSDVYLGIVDEIMETGANPVFVVISKQRYLVPYIMDRVVKKIDLAKHEIIVDWEVDF